VRVGLFLLVTGSFVVLLHIYLHRRLIRSVAGSTRWRRTGLVVLVLLMASSTFALAARHTPDSPILTWVGFVWLALVLYAAGILVVFEIPRAILARRLDERRRRFLSRALAATAAAVAAATVGYGVREARSPRVVRRDVPLDRLPRELDGLTIAALSDIHLGPLNQGPFLRAVVGQVNAERPDAVAIVGDLVDGTVAELGREAAPLGELHAPTFFVTGNHEYFSGAEAWCEFLPTLGVRVLRNERVSLGRLGAPPGAPTVDLAGIDDRTATRSHEPGHGANLAKALAGRDSSRTVVLLAHQPVMVDQAARADVDLQISGHTHGGQLLPFGYVVLLDQPVLAGLTRIGRTWLYVTRGVGFWGPPVRVGAPPEITLVTLRSR
jgi:predicted MPP superfamily phosphohydrolase